MTWEAAGDINPDVLNPWIEANRPSGGAKTAEDAEADPEKTQDDDVEGHDATDLTVTGSEPMKEGTSSRPPEDLETVTATEEPVGEEVIATEGESAPDLTLGGPNGQ